MRYAGIVATAEGVVALVFAAVLVMRGLGGADQHIVSGFGTAVWFALVGAGVIAAGWALITGRKWGRGIVVFANLLLLPVSWYVLRSHQPAYAVVVGVVALGVLALLFSPSVVHWMSGADGEDR